MKVSDFKTKVGGFGRAVDTCSWNWSKRELGELDMIIVFRLGLITQLVLHLGECFESADRHIQ